jgi:hypothetical protein
MIYIKLYTCSIYKMPKGLQRITNTRYHDTASKATFIDTTVKSGESIFAPTWPMVMGHKASTISDSEYTAQYLTMMRASFKANEPHWRTLLEQPDPIVLLCYCAARKFCHRLLLVDILLKIAPTYKISVTYEGEWEKKEG